jgi:hypothetical protein
MSWLQRWWLSFSRESTHRGKACAIFCTRSIHAASRFAGTGAIAVGLYPVIIVLGNAISAGVGLPEPALKATGLWYWLALDVLLTYLLFLFYGGGLEEPGWRGFAETL